MMWLNESKAHVLDDSDVDSDSSGAEIPIWVRGEQEVGFWDIRRNNLSRYHPSFIARRRKKDVIECNQSIKDFHVDYSEETGVRMVTRLNILQSSNRPTRGMVVSVAVTIPQTGSQRCRFGRLVNAAEQYHITERWRGRATLRRVLESFRHLECMGNSTTRGGKNTRRIDHLAGERGVDQIPAHGQIEAFGRPSTQKDFTLYKAKKQPSSTEELLKLVLAQEKHSEQRIGYLEDKSTKRGCESMEAIISLGELLERALRKLLIQSKDLKDDDTSSTVSEATIREQLELFEKITKLNKRLLKEEECLVRLDANLRKYDKNKTTTEEVGKTLTKLRTDMTKRLRNATQIDSIRGDDRERMRIVSTRCCRRCCLVVPQQEYHQSRSTDRRYKSNHIYQTKELLDTLV
ncbi:hypothetical protein NQ317_003386 [Molorchus minor]|uniref:Uncharacterized protein n=1 Tax=Molorchus minor TaxID=1323400 RepID=A0ABQ9K643_9CUCU|nr:hypothetical protein NQ317_003386 [Molorchus minor]